MPAPPKGGNSLEELAERIIYSERYSDDQFEYRHVILPKQMLKLIPKSFFSPEDHNTLRILEEGEWRGIGITQSLGWEHFEVHAPEPHIHVHYRESDPGPRRVQHRHEGKPAARK